MSKYVKVLIKNIKMIMGLNRIIYYTYFRMLSPINLDLKNTRTLRQNNNNKIVYDSIKANDIDTFSLNINNIELTRVLNDIELTQEELFNKCRDDYFCKLVARTLAKKSSRQGSKDEAEQLNACNLTANKCGITIANLSAIDFRATKNGKILSNKDIKKNNIHNDTCLKSFDGLISGKMNGFVSAKVAYGKGGHQDNVFEEMNTMGDWWKKYKKDSKDFLILLIDTDLEDKFKRIKQNYIDIHNILVYNHVEFQQYIIDRYHSSNDDSIESI